MPDGSTTWCSTSRLEGKAGYRVEITEHGAPRQRRRWEIGAEWPKGTAAISVDEKPSW
jgi:hypothetical protein